MKTWTCIVFALLVIWVGLWRGVEAGEYKPNSLWFCMTAGLLSIAGGFLFRLNQNTLAMGLATFSAAIILLFYLYCFIKQPEKDATFRVALAITVSIGQLSVLFLPRSPLEKDLVA